MFNVYVRAIRWISLLLVPSLAIRCSLLLTAEMMREERGTPTRFEPYLVVLANFSTALREEVLTGTARAYA